MKIHPEETRLNEFLRNLVNTFHAEAREKSLRLLVELPFADEKSWIRTDPVLLGKVLSSLINNAIRYTPSGVINIGYIRIGYFLQFYVKDTGVGIPKEQIHQLFHDQIIPGENSNSESGRSKHSLPVSKSIIELFGGQIWVESEVQQGSIFYFQIPYLECWSSTSTENSDSKKSVPKKIHILVAEDDIHSLMFLKTLLTLEGFAVLEAGNGRKAVEKVKSNPEIDLVLIDMKMPEMDGIEATILIKEIRPELPVIAQTAYALNDDFEKARQAGCNDYITKPVKKQLLIEKISKLIHP